MRTLRPLTDSTFLSAILQDVFAVANGRVVFAENCGRLWGNQIKAVRPNFR